ncbi:PfkB family carbohydrate kinase [Zophobihabitans entericus]|uniref:Ribokinase n=1 Tax=Zophobihabitans entericus TaxID=1635327 RepID=A0A6G9IA73_9GAMM|nr:PfkB family carbohydrate kinase [Zophobihabitans entericus]QIQ20729.1 ribokinase [Zophobihabitans entericus]
MNIKDLQNTAQQRPIVIVGAAVGDIVLAIDKLPLSGQDIAGRLLAQQIGGCAFNIARILSKLNLALLNGIPVGTGTWATTVENEMKTLKLPVSLRHLTKDNGWCLAFVEPDGERTFVSIENGCECDWDQISLKHFLIPENSLVYLSGYELAATSSTNLHNWILQIPDSCTFFVDLGPRLKDISPALMAQLLKKNILLTINQDEIALLCGNGDSIKQVQTFIQHYPNITVIARLGKQGAWLCQTDQEPLHVPTYEVTVIDTIGAGDAHCAGVIAGLSLGIPLADTITLGNQIAAIMVSRLGVSNPPDWKDIIDFSLSH